MSRLIVIDNKQIKAVKSFDYNFIFDKTTGTHIRWGKTKNTEDDPTVAPAPEILDLEISAGDDCIGCKYCYKANGPDAGKTHNLSFDDFVTIFNKMPKTLTQIAFGIMNINTNPDFFRMMEYSRQHGVIPNYTTSGVGVSELIASETAKLCGAVAVSCHIKEVAYDAVKKFTDAGMTQVNIHQVIYKENFDEVMNLLQDRVSDPRLAKLRAIVFLAYKPKGTNAGQFTSCSVDQYRILIEFCEIHKINPAFDSCSAPAVLRAYYSMSPQKYKEVHEMIEPCESSCFSSYINCKGEYFPCSFTEGEPGWETGLNVLTATDFVKDIWNHSRSLAFRNNLFNTTTNCEGCPSQQICRHCPIFEVTSCHKAFVN